MQRALIVISLLIAAVGVLWPWLSRLPFGRLPGDIVVDKPGFKLFAPFTTMIVLSLVVGLLIWLFRRWSGSIVGIRATRAGLQALRLETLMALTPTSSAFSHNGPIPNRCTCQGKDISVPLVWSRLSAGTKSLPLIVDDPDAPDPPRQSRPGACIGSFTTSRQALPDWHRRSSRATCPTARSRGATTGDAQAMAVLARRSVGIAVFTSSTRLTSSCRISSTRVTGNSRTRPRTVRAGRRLPESLGPMSDTGRPPAALRSSHDIDHPPVGQRAPCSTGERQ